MTDTIFHGSLKCTLKGLHDSESQVVHFRGITYGTIPRRYAAAETVETAAHSSRETLDCTRFGPRCPQVLLDAGYLLRLPPSHALGHEEEDEFKCLNLDVMVPEQYAAARHSPDQAHARLPVMIFIHGGSQAFTYCSAASGVCDMTKIVSDSAALGEPIITVFVQYRLNIFSHANETGPKNLALLDQALAIQWVYEHIHDFGGDRDNITLAGESAGAVYIHAHMVRGNPIIKQCVLLSGSLYLSPPQRRDVIDALRGKVLDELRQLDSTADLENASSDKIVEAMTRLGPMSWFLEDDACFDGWRNTVLRQKLLVSDVQQESVLWRSGLWAAPTASIVDAFSLAPARLAEIYSIDPTRPSSCVLGALDFINDYKFLLPAEILASSPARRSHETPGDAGAVYRCIVDEANPFQPAHGAHHAVDLLLLFGGCDRFIEESSPGSAPGFLRTGREMRRRFIKFINGAEPWEAGSVAAFGPWGLVKELARDGEELKMRRRMGHLEVLSGMEGDVLERVFMELARGRISLLN